MPYDISNWVNQGIKGPPGDELDTPTVEQELRLPVVDISKDDDEQLVRDIRAAAEANGAFMVTGHGIDSTLWPRVQAAGKKFFAMPEQQKKALRCPPVAPGLEMKSGYVAYGYQEAGRECIAAVSIGDRSAAADPVEKLSLCEDSQGRLHDNPRVLWPSDEQTRRYDLHELRPSMEEYYAEMKSLSIRVWALMGKAMGVEKGSLFESPPGESVCRLLRYLPKSLSNSPKENSNGMKSEKTESSKLRMAPHTDIGPFTILPPDQTESLEYWTTKGWQRVAYEPNTFLVHLGDSMTYWTAGAWPSMWHRVSPCRDGERFSMPFFARANSELPMTVLPHYGASTKGRNTGGTVSNGNTTTLKRRVNIYNVNDLTLEDIHTMEQAEYALHNLKKMKTRSTAKSKEDKEGTLAVDRAEQHGCGNRYGNKSTSASSDVPLTSIEANDIDGPPMSRRAELIVPGSCKTLGDYVLFKARPGFFQRGASANEPSTELHEGAAAVEKQNQSSTSCAAMSSVDGADASPLDGDVPLPFQRMPSTVC